MLLPALPAWRNFAAPASCLLLLAPAASADASEPLEEIVITATRTGIPLAIAPASVSVVTAGEIVQMNILTIDEALRNLAGVMVRRTKGFMETTPSLTLRGLANARDSLVLLDGAPQNDARNGQVNWTMIDSELIERIEVVRGPFSSLYGGNAMGGVVSLFSREPTVSGIAFKAGFGGSLDSEAPDGTQDIAVSGWLKVTEALTLGASYRQRSTDGYATTHVNVSNAAVAALPAGVTGAVPYRSNIGAATNLVGNMGDNWYEDETYGLRLSYRWSDASRLRLSWTRSEGDYGYDTPSPLLRTVDGAPTLANIPLTTWLNGALFARGGSVDQDNLGLLFETTLGPLETQLKIGHIDKTTETIIVGGITVANSGHPPRIPVTLEGGDGRLAPVNDTTRTNADLQFVWPVNTKHRVTFGFAGVWGDIDEQRWSLSDWTDPNSRFFMGSRTIAEDRTAAVYAQDEWSMTDALTLYLGARGDWWEMTGGKTERFETTGASGTLSYTSTRASAFSPKATLVYRAGVATTLRASAGRAFRPPTLFEFFGTAQIGGNSFVGNPSLQPETTKSVEAGIDQRFGNTLSLVATVFFSRLEDRIQTVTVAGVARPENTSEAEISGVEVELGGALPAGFRWTANYTYTDAEVTRDTQTPALVGKALSQVPEHQYNLVVDWTWRAWQLTGSYHYLSDRFTRADNLDLVNGVPGSTDAFGVADLKLGFAPTPNYRISLGVSNVFNEEYRQFYLSPGRTWLLEFRASY